MLEPQVLEQFNELRASKHALVRETDDAHDVLDEMEIPRYDRFHAQYTLAARLELVKLDFAAKEVQLQQSRHAYDMLAVMFAGTERRRLHLEAELVTVHALQRIVRRMHIARRALAEIRRTIVLQFADLFSHTTSSRPK